VVTRRDRLLRAFYRLVPPSLHRRAAYLLSLYHADRVCDIGGGAGHLARALEEAGERPGLHVIVDPDRGLLEMAPGYPWLERVEAVAERLPLRGGSCRFAVFHDALHHIEEPEAALDEALKVARCIYLDDFDVKTLAGKLIKLLEKAAGYPANFFSRDELLELLRGRGLRVLHVEEGGPGAVRVVACLPERLD